MDAHISLIRAILALQKFHAIFYSQLAVNLDISVKMENCKHKINATSHRTLDRKYAGFPSLPLTSLG